jgi:hypothetical protein
MTGADLVAELRGRGVILSARGERLAYDAPSGVVTAEVLAALKAHKTEILATLSPKPVANTWRRDEHGRLWFSDGTVYAPTAAGGWVLVKHPTRQMQAPGTVEVTKAQYLAIDNYKKRTYTFGHDAHSPTSTDNSDVRHEPIRTRSAIRSIPGGSVPIPRK